MPALSPAQMKTVSARVIWLLGARDESGGFDGNVSDERFLEQEIQHAVIETESELMLDIAETRHALRQGFLIWTDDLNHQDEIPEHIGQVEAVQIRKFPGGQWEKGRRANRDNIEEWRENYNKIFGDKNHTTIGSRLSGRYEIENNTIYFTGVKARVRICSYTPDFNENDQMVLQAPDILTPGLVSGGVAKLGKHGVPAQMVGHYASEYIKFRQVLRGGAMVLPEISEVQAQN